MSNNIPERFSQGVTASVESLPYPLDKTDIQGKNGKINSNFIELKSLRATHPVSNRENSSHKHQTFQTPPAPSKTVTLRLAESSLNFILSAFNLRDEDTQKPITITDFERGSMDSMSLAASLLNIKFFSDTAAVKAAALEIRSDGAEKLRLRQNDELRQQINKAIEDQSKAQKAGIVSVVVSWATAVAEIASAAVKFVAQDYVGAALDLAAGTAGLVKAICETAALVDPDNAEKYLHIADIAGKIQLGFEIASMAVDILSVGRAVAATRCIGKTTEAIVEKGTGELLKDVLGGVTTAAEKEVAKEIIHEVAKEIGREVAESVAKEVAESFGKELAKNVTVEVAKNVTKEVTKNVTVEVAKNASKEVAKEVAKEVSKEVTEVIVKEVVKKSAKEVAKNLVKQIFAQGPLVQAFAKEAIKEIVAKGAEKAVVKALEAGTKATAKDITKAIVKQVQREVLSVIMKTILGSTGNIIKNSVTASSKGINHIFQGKILDMRADLQQVIKELIADSMFMQFLLDEFEDIKKRAKEEISNATDNAGKALSSASDTQLKTSTTLLSIAANITK